MSTAAVVAQLAAAGAWQDVLAAAKTGPWIAGAVGLAMLGGRLVLGRRSRITHLVILPPAEVGDDTLEMLRGWDAAAERLVREGERHG